QPLPTPPSMTVEHDQRLARDALRPVRSGNGDVPNDLARPNIRQLFWPGGRRMRQRVCGRVGEPAAACLRESLPPRESASANVSCGRIRVEKRDLIKLDPPAGDTYGTVQADAAVSEPNSGRDRTLLRHG